MGAAQKSPQKSQMGVPTPHPALVQALRRLLRPLVRLLLSQQVTFPYLATLLKSVYVDVAEREFAIAGRTQTDSRLTLLTGVHRKDVKRLRSEAPSEDAAPAVVSLGAQLVARWTSVPEFLDADGRPRPLARHAAGEGEPGFEELVASVSKDIRPRAVLDEWLRLGVVRVDEGDRVCLDVEAFVPRRGFDEMAFYFGRNLHDHIAAGTHNLGGEGPPLLERSVYYDELTPDSVDELAVLAEREAMKALKAVNKRALALQRADASKPGNRLRMNFGTYFYRADEPGAENDDD